MAERTICPLLLYGRAASSSSSLLNPSRTRTALRRVPSGRREPPTERAPPVDANADAAVAVELELMPRKGEEQRSEMCVKVRVGECGNEESVQPQRKAQQPFPSRAEVSIIPPSQTRPPDRCSRPRRCGPQRRPSFKLLQ